MVKMENESFNISYEEPIQEQMKSVFRYIEDKVTNQNDMINISLLIRNLCDKVAINEYLNITNLLLEVTEEVIEPNRKELS